MSMIARISLLSIAGLILLSQTACTLVPRQTLRYSQLRTLQLHNQNQSISMERSLHKQFFVGFAEFLNVPRMI